MSCVPGVKTSQSKCEGEGRNYPVTWIGALLIGKGGDVCYRWTVSVPFSLHHPLFPSWPCFSLLILIYFLFFLLFLSSLLSLIKPLSQNLLLSLTPPRVINWSDLQGHMLFLYSVISEFLSPSPLLGEKLLKAQNYVRLKFDFSHDYLNKNADSGNVLED